MATIRILEVSMNNNELKGVPIEKVLMVYPKTNDKYHLYMKTFKKVLIRTDIAEEDIHMLAVKDIDDFVLGEDDVYTVAFLPESSAFNKFNEDTIHKVFPLLEGVALSYLYYYNSVGNIYGLMGNIDVAETLSNSQEILESLGVINKDGEVLYNFEEGGYINNNDATEQRAGENNKES